MGIITGNARVTADFIEKYWLTGLDIIDDQFVGLYRSDRIFLTSSDCIDLRRKTYLNISRPFGKVDKDSIVGEVCVSEYEIEKFNLEINDALKLVRNSPSLRCLVDSAVKFYVPLAGLSLREQGSGKSCHWLKGAVFLSVPQSGNYKTFELALNLVHELGHQVLMLFQDCDPIMSDIRLPVYSAIRKTQRPAILSFHALIAIYFMLHLCKSVLSSEEVVDLQYRRHIYMKAETLSSDLIAGAYSLRHIEFSPLGLSLMDEMLDFNLESRSAG